jgi:hypothetical protein
MTVAPAAACPPPLPTRTVADDVRAAPDFARRRRGWVVEELFAEAGVVILGPTPPRANGTGHQAWVIERAQGWLRVTPPTAPRSGTSPRWAPPWRRSGWPKPPRAQAASPPV